MNASETEDGAKEQMKPVSVHGSPVPSPDASTVPGTKIWVTALIVALVTGVVAWSLAGRFRVGETVLRDRRRGEGVFSGFAELSVMHAIRNGIAGYAILGAILALGLGVTAGLLYGRRSNSGVFLAGLMGLVLGACGGAASSYVLIPVYFRGLETADLTFSILIHLGIWTAIGAASGVAFGIGSGSRAVFVRSLIGGITGAALGTLLFDIAGAFLPLAHTEKPLAEEAGTRLAATMLVSICVAIGILVVASQRPRVTTNFARPTN
jgi:hypothetical protein